MNGIKEVNELFETDISVNMSCIWKEQAETHEKDIIETNADIAENQNGMEIENNVSDFSSIDSNANANSDSDRVISSIDSNTNANSDSDRVISELSDSESEKDKKNE